jgi:hypothetical protein
MRGRRFLLNHSEEHGSFYRERGFVGGDLVKVVMVSRFGDCGITKDLTAENGYNLRVPPKALMPIEEIPDSVCRECFYEKAGHDGKCIEPVRLG